jgi:hypothetical protein
MFAWTQPARLILFPHTLFLQTRSGYVSSLRSYIPDSYYFVQIHGVGYIRHPSKCFLVFLKDLSLGLCCTIFLLTTSAIILNFFSDDIKNFRTVTLQLNVLFYSLTLIPFAVGVQQTVSNLIMKKLDLLPLQGKLMQLIIITNCVIQVWLILILLKI